MVSASVPAFRCAKCPANLGIRKCCSTARTCATNGSWTARQLNHTKAHMLVDIYTAIFGNSSTAVILHGNVKASSASWVCWESLKCPAST